MKNQKTRHPHVKDPVKEFIAEYNNKINLALLALSKFLKFKARVPKETIQIAIKNLRQAKSLPSKYGLGKRK